jgi:hypothetical protein
MLSEPGGKGAEVVGHRGEAMLSQKQPSYHERYSEFLGIPLRLWAASHPMRRRRLHGRAASSKKAREDTTMDEAHRLILYKILHLAGLMAVFSGIAVAMTQGKDGSLRKSALMFHGVGLFLLLVSGFGMVARLGVSYASGWVLLKVAIWLFFGGAVVLAKKGILKGPSGWAICIALGVVAAWAGLLKPF